MFTMLLDNGGSKKKNTKKPKQNIKLSTNIKDLRKENKTWSRICRKGSFLQNLGPVLSHCCLPGTRLGPRQRHRRTNLHSHPALCSTPSLAAHRCPCNLLPTLNWTTPLVFCSGLAPAIFHLLSLKKKNPTKKAVE